METRTLHAIMIIRSSKSIAKACIVQPPNLKKNICWCRKNIVLVYFQSLFIFALFWQLTYASILFPLSIVSEFVLIMLLEYICLFEIPKCAHNWMNTDFPKTFNCFTLYR